MSGARTAVVLAAGMGLRLRPLTDTLPKTLVPVAGKPILTHILEGLRDGAGVREFVIAVGYKAEAFGAYSVPDGCRITRVDNPRWEQSNSMLSLALCMTHLAHGGFVVEGDCCFGKELLGASGWRENGSSWFAHPFGAGDDGCCLRANDSGLITRLTIEKKGVAATGEASESLWKSCGVLELTARSAAQVAGWLDDAVKAGREKQYYDLILADHLRDADLHVADIGGAPWFEIDNAGDLQTAEDIFRAARP